MIKALTLAAAISALSYNTAIADDFNVIDSKSNKVNVEVLDRMVSQSLSQFSIEDLKEESKHKNENATFALGLKLLVGNDVDKNISKGIKYIKRASRQGHKEAGFVLGEFYENGNFVKQSLKNSAKWKEMSAKLDHIDSMVDVADFYAQGSVVRKDLSKAERWYRLAASYGNLEATEKLAKYYDQIGNDRGSFEYHSRMMKAGSYESRRMVSDFYFEGVGVERDMKKALDTLDHPMFDDDADINYEKSQFYINGWGVEKDDEKALELLQKSAKDGFVPAYYAIATMFMSDEAKDNDEEALALLNIAAKKNHGLSQYAIGVAALDSDDVELAVDMLTKASDNGVASASKEIGMIYYQGEIVEKDDEIAFGFLTRAVDGEAYYTLSKIIYEEDPVKSEDLLIKASDLGFPKAQHELANILVKEGGYDFDIIETLFKSAVDQGHKEALQDYANYVIEEKGYVAAMPVLIKSVHNNDPISLYNMGVVYAGGIGRPQDYFAAYDYFMKSALVGYPKAQYEAGTYALEGIGTLVNIPEAIRFFAMAAKNDVHEANDKLGDIYSDKTKIFYNMNPSIGFYEKAVEAGIEISKPKLARALYQAERFDEAAVYLEEADDIISHEVKGMMLLNGKGFEKDKNDAFDHLLEAAELGSLSAAFNVGVLYIEGTGTRKSYKKAFPWLMKVAENGDTEAQIIIASMYYEGEGVKKDLSEAYKWAYIANKKTNNQIKRYTNLKLEIASDMDSFEVKKIKESLN